MVRLVRAQTADGSTVIEFLDDVMQDRNEGFRPHHRIAAAKELIVHIVRDEAPEPIPEERTPSVHPELVEGPEPNSIVVPAAGSIVIPAEAGTHPLNAERNSTVVPTAGSIVVPGPSAVVPAESLPPSSRRREPIPSTLSLS